jgi:hypothetical protein
MIARAYCVSNTRVRLATLEQNLHRVCSSFSLNRIGSFSFKISDLNALECCNGRYLMALTMEDGKSYAIPSTIETGSGLVLSTRSFFSLATLKTIYGFQRCVISLTSLVTFARPIFEQESS